MTVDDFLEKANEVQLRNVLAMASRSIPDAEFMALVQREARMAARESQGYYGSHNNVVFINQQPRA